MDANDRTSIEQVLRKLKILKRAQALPDPFFSMPGVLEEVTSLFYFQPRWGDVLVMSGSASVVNALWKMKHPRTFFLFPATNPQTVSSFTATARVLLSCLRS